MSEFKPATSGACAFSSVASSASSVAILAANNQRKGATVYNTDANALHLRLDGGTATTTTGFNVKLDLDEYFEVPFGYTGAISGIWAADGTGAANVAEFT